MSVGTQYITPEAGWKRIDCLTLYRDTNTKVKGTWIPGANNKFYNGTELHTNEANASLTFFIKSYRFRMISRLDTDRSANGKLIVDGDEHILNLHDNGGSPYIALVYHEEYLTQYHKISYVSGSDSYNLKAIIDAIDIDSDGSLISEEEYIINTTKDIRFPVLIGDEKVTSEEDIQAYAETVTDGRRQLLIADKLKGMYVTDGKGDYTKIIDENTTDHINREVLDLLSTDGESLYFNGKNIQKIELEDGQYGYTSTFMNVTTDTIYNIDISDGSGLCEQIVQAWEFEEGTTNITNIAKTFNNAEKDNFYYDSENGIEFTEDVCKIKDEFELSISLNSDGFYESEVINKSDFLELIGMEVK